MIRQVLTFLDTSKLKERGKYFICELSQIGSELRKGEALGRWKEGSINENSCKETRLTDWLVGAAVMWRGWNLAASDHNTLSYSNFSSLNSHSFEPAINLWLAEIHSLESINLSVSSLPSTPKLKRPSEGYRRESPILLEPLLWHMVIVF